MDTARLGRSVRVLRGRRGWTQEALGRTVGLSRETVSRVERGDVGGVRLDTLAALATALGARLEVGLYWRGERLDRLLDAAHAHLVDRTVATLGRHGWETTVEVTFSHYGERGAIDVLARLPSADALLVVEVKSTIPDLQAMLAGLDRKARLAPVIARGRGWSDPAVVGRILVVPDGRTVRRRIAEHRSLLAAALPDRGAEVRAWVRAPTPHPLSGILVLPYSRGVTARP